MEARGTVAGGSAKASALGYPTANIPLPAGIPPGAYASSAQVGEATYEAVSYADGARGVLETHLFGFSGDLYGKAIMVRLHKRIREPEAFDSDEELVRAIAADAAAARSYHEKA